jgi:hypothetical protein
MLINAPDGGSITPWLIAYLLTVGGFPLAPALPRFVRSLRYPDYPSDWWIFPPWHVNWIWRLDLFKTEISRQFYFNYARRDIKIEMSETFE